MTHHSTCRGLIHQGQRNQVQAGNKNSKVESGGISSSMHRNPQQEMNMCNAYTGLKDFHCCVSSTVSNYEPANAVITL